MMKLFDRIIEYGFYALFFFTPLIFNPLRNLPSYELFEWNKMMFVYFLTVAIASCWVGKMILSKKFLFRRTPFDLPLLLFLLSQTLSTIFSIDPHVSLFGYYSRFHGGLLSTITYLTLYFAFVSNYESVQFDKLVKFILASGTIVSIYGIAERFGIDANMWVQDVRSRVFSTLGQPNWLAAYLAILLPISIVQLFKYNSSSPPLKLRGGKVGLFDNWIIGIYLVIGLLFYICILFTKSRSGFLGFWIANIFFWAGHFLLTLFRHPGKASPKLHPGSALNSDSGQARMTIFLILNSSFLILNFFIRTPFPQYNWYLTRDIFNKQTIVEETKAPLGDSVINVGITDSADIRRIVWKGAIDITKAYPLFGTGPETFAYAYYKYRPPAHNLTSEWDFLYNRAHNEFLNIAATSGFFGLGVYILLIFTVIIWTLKSFLQTTNYKLQTTNLALLAAYISILITNFFGFSVVVIGLYFFLIPACIWSLCTQTKTTLNQQNSLQTSQKIGFGLVGIGMFFLFSQLVRLWMSDSLFARAYNFSKGEHMTAAYPYIVSATTMRPDEPVYHDERATIAGTLALAAFETKNATLTAELAKEAIDQSSQAIKTSPQNVNFWKTRTRIFYLLSVVKPEFVNDALDSIRIAWELAPTDAKIAYNVAIILGHSGKNLEAIEVLKKTIVLKPDYRDAYVALSIFYKEEKQFDKAKDILTEFLKRVDPNDEEIKKRIEELK